MPQHVTFCGENARVHIEYLQKQIPHKLVASVRMGKWEAGALGPEEDLIISLYSLFLFWKKVI